MSLMMQDAIWDIMESEAFVAVYLNGPDHNAESPAILVLSGYSPLASCKKMTSYELWFSLIGKQELPDMKAVITKIGEILSSSKVPLRPKVVLRHWLRVRKQWDDFGHKFGAQIICQGHNILYEIADTTKGTATGEES
jgi:hypothetical protein